MGQCGLAPVSQGPGEHPQRHPEVLEYSICTPYKWGGTSEQTYIRVTNFFKGGIMPVLVTTELGCMCLLGLP